MDYKKINNNYKKYKLSKKKESMKEICKPKNFKLQPQQKFLGEYLFISCIAFVFLRWNQILSFLNIDSGNWYYKILKIFNSITHLNIW